MYLYNLQPHPLPPHIYPVNCPREFLPLARNHVILDECCSVQHRAYTPRRLSPTSGSTRKCMRVHGSKVVWEKIYPLNINVFV